MSDLIAIDDLNLLNGGDLRAVFGQLAQEQLAVALIGLPTGLRQILLSKLPAASARALEEQIQAHGPVGSEAVRAAQSALIEALLRLSRGAQIAFDDPEDMVA